MITTLEVEINKKSIICGGEDSYLNIWKVDDKNDVNFKASYRMADQ